MYHSKKSSCFVDFSQSGQGAGREDTTGHWERTLGLKSGHTLKGSAR